MNRWLFALVALVALVGCASAHKKPSVSPPPYTGIGEAVVPPASESANVVSSSPAAEPTAPLQDQSQTTLVSDLELVDVVAPQSQEEWVAGDQQQDLPNNVFQQDSKEVQEGIWEEYPISSGDTVTGILAAHGISSKLVQVIERNALENPNMIFAGQTLWIPEGEKPEVAETSSSINNASETSSTTPENSLGKILVDTFSPRARAERRAQVESGPTATMTLATQYGDVLIEVPAEVLAGTNSDSASGWRDGIPEQRLMPSRDELNLLLNELERAKVEIDLLREQIVKNHEREVALAKRIKRVETEKFSFGLFLGTIQRWYASIGEGWLWWERAVWGGILTLLVAIGMFLVARWYTNQNDWSPPGQDKTLLMDRRGFFRKILDGVRGWRSGRIANQESKRIAEAAALERAEIALGQKDNVRSIHQKSRTG